MSHRRFGRSLVLCLALLGAAAAHAADDFSASWGPSLGSAAPAISAPDQTGAVRDLDSLGRENGLLFLFARSADW